MLIEEDCQGIFEPEVFPMGELGGDSTRQCNHPTLSQSQHHNFHHPRTTPFRNIHTLYFSVLSSPAIAISSTIFAASRASSMRAFSQWLSIELCVRVAAFDDLVIGAVVFLFSIPLGWRCHVSYMSRNPQPPCGRYVISVLYILSPQLNTGLFALESNAPFCPLTYISWLPFILHCSLLPVPPLPDILTTRCSVFLDLIALVLAVVQKSWNKIQAPTLPTRLTNIQPSKASGPSV